MRSAWQLEYSRQFLTRVLPFQWNGPFSNVTLLCEQIDAEHCDNKQITVFYKYECAI